MAGDDSGQGDSDQPTVESASSGNISTIEDLEAEIDRLFGSSYTTRIRNQSPLNILFYVLSVAFVGYHLWYAFTVGLPRTQHGIIHLLFVLPLWGLKKALDELGQQSSDARSMEDDEEANVDVTDGENSQSWSWVAGGYLAYAIVSTIVVGYFATNYWTLLSRRGIFPLQDIAIGAILIGLVFIALLHISYLVSAFSAVGFVYAYFGPVLPGFFRHGGLSIQRIITMNTAEMTGIFGDFLIISATWIVIFLIYAGFLEAYGGMAALIRGFSRLLARSRRVEIGQVAVLASMVLGSINGSTAANTAITGSFTIPLLKSNQYPPRLAAAIESVASCGGQILPPIMGAGAFLMASLIDPTYTEIILAAIIPATLFYISVAFSISLFTRRTQAVKHLEQTESKQTSWQNTITTLLWYYDYIISIVMLLYWLIVVQASPLLAGFYAIVALIGLRIPKVVWEGYTNDALGQTVRRFVRDTFEASKKSVVNTLEITIIVVGLATVVRAFIVTGLAQSISTQLLIIAGNSILLLLVLSMVTAIIFGMGMSTTPAYLLVAILVAPALTGAGIAPLIAHLFVFTFAIVSNITPPIALSVVIAQGIAGSDFTETVVEALRMGFPMFLIPYVIYAQPEILQPSFSIVPMAIAIALGFMSIAVGLVGTLSRDYRIYERAAFIVVGFVAIFMPNYSIQLIVGAGLVALFYLAYRRPNILSYRPIP